MPSICIIVVHLLTSLFSSTETTDLLQAAESAEEQDSARLFELLSVVEIESRAMAVSQSEGLHQTIQAARQARLAAFEEAQAREAMEIAVRARIAEEIEAAHSAAVAMGMLGHDIVTSVSGAATALANVGPGLGPIIGPAGASMRFVWRSTGRPEPSRTDMVTVASNGRSVTEVSGISTGVTRMPSGPVVPPSI